MTRDQSTDSSNLVPSTDKALTSRSATLVRRTLTDLSLASISSNQIERLRSALCQDWFEAHDERFEQQAEAARTVISIGPRLNLGDDGVAGLLFCLVNAMEWVWFQLAEGDLDHAAAWQQHRRLLMRAIQALVGPGVALRTFPPSEVYCFDEVAPAVLAALVRGATQTKIRAAELLSHAELSERVLAKFVAIASELLAQSNEEELLLVLEYALAVAQHHDPDALYTQLAGHAMRSHSEALRERARAYLESLAHDVSVDAHWEADIALAHDDDTQNAELGAAGLFRWNLDRALAICRSQVLDLMLGHGLEMFAADVRPAEFIPPEPPYAHSELRDELTEWKEHYTSTAPPNWKNRPETWTSADLWDRFEGHCDRLDALMLLIDALETRASRAPTEDPS